MVGIFDAITLRIVVSGILSMIGCSLLASVLLSVFESNVMGTNLYVVVSGDVDGFVEMVVFW